MNREPTLLPKLNKEKINKIRKYFDNSPEINRTDFHKLINKYIVHKDRLSVKDFDVIFHKMDTDESGSVDIVEFLDFLLYESSKQHGYYVEQIGDASSTSGYGMNNHNYLGVHHIQFMPCALKENGCIRKIHHLNVSCHEISVSKEENRGLYVTVIGKRSLGFWRPDLTMITDAPFYLSKEIPEFSEGISEETKRNFQLKRDKMVGRNAKRAIERYDQQIPEFDIVCMEDFQMIACFQILNRSLLFYDMKVMKLKCCITDLPVEVSCVDYTPNRDEVSRLFIGGANGGFLILEFLSSVELLTKFKDDTVMTHRFSEIPASDIRVHRVRCHEKGYVTQIKFFNYKLNHQLFVLTSSLLDFRCPKTCNTLAATEFLVQKTRPKFIATISPPAYFQLSDSVNTFTVAGDGVLVSGGWDSYVRVWYLSEVERRLQYCHAELQGHKAAIIGVHYHVKYSRIISMSNDGVINVWNYMDRSVTQTFNATHLMPRLYRYIHSYVPKLPDVPPAFYFCKATESVLLGEESLIVIPFGDVTKEKHLTAM